MKIRSGFVSNSSSYSFVIFGVEKELDYEKDEELIEYFETNGGWIRSSDQGISLIGVTLVYGDNFEVTEFDPNDPELQEEAQEVADKIGVPLSEFKFYAGTIYG